MVKQMYKRTYKACLILLVLCLAFLATSTQLQAESSEQTPGIYDQADLFRPADKERIQELIGKLSAAYKVDVIVVTTNDAEGKDSRNYANDFFDAHIPESADGAIILIDMDNRNLMVTTQGRMIDVITDMREETLYDLGVPELKDEHYGDAAYVMLDQMGYFLQDGVPADGYRISEEELAKQAQPVPKSVSPLNGLFALIGGGATYGLITSPVKRSYKAKTKNPRYNRKAYVHPSILANTDQLIDTQTSVRDIPRPTPSSRASSGGSSGRSTTHRSSSGRTHGGGHGRGF